MMLSDIRSQSRPLGGVVGLLFVVSILFAPALSMAEDSPPISASEKVLEQVPGHAHAPAVVLYKKAELKLMEYPTEVSSFLKLQVRIKILNEEGKDYGEVEIPHSAFYRLRDIEGRTVLPDGRIIPLPKEAIFEERRSRSNKTFVTKLVFPSVEAGAILDYRYTVRWDHLFFIEPWYFHNEIPTLLSEIVYIKPPNIGLDQWGVQAGVPIQSEARKGARGAEYRIWSENLPAIPDEDYSFPFGDLSSRFMMIPKVVQAYGDKILLMDSWRSTCELYADSYKDVRRKDRKAQQKASELAAGQTSLLDKIAVLHAFVRDDIQSLWSVGVGINGEENRVDKILDDRQATAVGKALVLQSMLEAIKVESDLVWAPDRSEGMVDLKVANPWWFDTALVRVVVDGEPIFLDPADRSAGFGYLAARYEGMPAVVFDKTKPEVIELPRAPHGDNHRIATVGLEVDDEGRLKGQGTLELGGHEAWQFFDLRDTREETEEMWREWLENRYPGFDISAVELEEDRREMGLRLGWDLGQRDEDVLGDEASIKAAGALAVSQIFSLPPDVRRTPVLLNNGRLDESHVTVRWGEGWEIDAPLDDVTVETASGRFERRIEGGDGELVIHRRFERPGHEYTGSDSYGALRDLYEEASKADAQSLVLILE